MEHLFQSGAIRAAPASDRAVLRDRVYSCTSTLPSIPWMSTLVGRRRSWQPLSAPGCWSRLSCRIPHGRRQVQHERLVRQQAGAPLAQPLSGDRRHCGAYHRPEYPALVSDPSARSPSGAGVLPGRDSRRSDRSAAGGAESDPGAIAGAEGPVAGSLGAAGDPSGERCASRYYCGGGCGTAAAGCPLPLSALE